MRRTPCLGLALVGLLRGNCTPSVRPTNVTLERYDQDTEYAVTPRDNGFTLTIYSSRYQFVPESAVIAMACKRKPTAMAHDLAEKQGRKLRPVDEQRLTITMERNGFRGITSCAGSAIAEWE